MKLKILSLNLFRYYQDWEKRRVKIIEYIKEIGPDIVVLQECFDDSRHNELGNNQARQLNKDLKYRNCIYSKTEKLKSEAGKEVHAEVYDGLGFLTNFSIISKKDISLPRAEGDKHTRIIQSITLEKGGEKFVLYHTHFSNRDFWAKPQLEETMRQAEKELITPIILGDLNIKSSGDLLDTARKGYVNSWHEKKYLSFPKDNETYDYILLPRGKWKFEKIVCEKGDLSDHKALSVEISKLGIGGD